MAQVVKLKRTSVQGRIPSISNLELGELAINTHDGRIFFEKDNGELSIQEILTTNSQNSGSFNLTGAITTSYINANGSGNSILVGDTLRIDENGSGLRMTNVGAFDNSSGDFRIFANQDLILATNGENGTAVTIDQTTKDANFVSAVTASYFVGDGSGLTNLQVSSSITEVATVTSSFDNESTISVLHSFDSKNIIVSVYGTDYSQIIPQSVTLTDNDTVDIVLSNTGSGHVVVAKGGHIIASSDLDSYRLDVSGASSYAITHSLNEEYPFVQVWNTETKKMEQPLDVETTSSSSLTVSFSSNFSGKIIVKK